MSYIINRCKEEMLNRSIEDYNNRMQDNNNRIIEQSKIKTKDNEIEES